eukprot:2970270-Karenia_brevis.AAC.1
MVEVIHEISERQPEPRRAPETNVAAVESVTTRGRWAPASPTQAIADLPPRPPPPQRARSHPTPQS